MARGDAYIVGLTQETNGSSLTIQPGSGVEVVIHNIDFPEGSAWELYRTDGSNSILIASGISAAVNLQYHATNAQYYTLKNVSGATVYCGVTGMVTK